jgi:AcrR family transcriptional regulator
MMDDMSPASRDANKPYHHGDLRQAMLDATLALIEEHGPEGFTLRAAARGAGVSPGAAYHHFKDKEDLVAAVAQEGFAMMRTHLAAAAEKPHENMRERSRNVGTAYVVFALRHPTRFRVMLGYGLIGRANSPSAANEAMATYRLVREVLIAGLEESSAERVSEPEVLGWWSVVHGLAFLAIDGYLGCSAKNVKGTEQLVLSVIDALDRRAATVPGKPKKSR